MRWALVLALAALGCPAPKQYAVQRPGLDCERAVRVAYRTMNTIGYAVTDVVPPTGYRPGVIAGVKHAPDGTTLTGRVRIECNAQGAELQPIEDALLPNFEFSRLFDYSFKSLVQRPDVEEPVKQTGLQVLVEVMDASRSQLDLGGMPTTAGTVPVRITVRNDTDRAIAVDPADVELVTADGTSATPLAGPALDAALVNDSAGSRVRAEQLAHGRIAPHTTAVRFLVYPAARYKEARLSIEDVETQESEGFVAPVQ